MHVNCMVLRVVQLASARTAWSLCLAILLCSQPRVAQGLEYQWRQNTGNERITLQFQEEIPGYQLQRTGRTTLRLQLPPGYWENYGQPPAIAPDNAALVESVTATPQGLEIQLTTDAFGYIHYPDGDGAVVALDLFQDPLGARWRPQENLETQPADPQPQPAPENAPAPQPQPETAAAEEPAPEQETEPAAKPETAQARQEAPEQSAASAREREPGLQDQTEPSPQLERLSPNAFRGQIRKANYDEVEMASPQRDAPLPLVEPDTEPAPQPQTAAGAGSVAGKVVSGAVRPGPSPGGQTANVAPAQPAAQDLAATPGMAGEGANRPLARQETVGQEPNELRAQMAPPGQSTAVLSTPGAAASAQDSTAIAPEAAAPEAAAEDKTAGGSVVSGKVAADQVAVGPEPFPFPDGEETAEAELNAGEGVLPEDMAQGERVQEEDNASLEEEVFLEEVEESMAEGSPVQQTEDGEPPPPTAEELFDMAQIAYVNKDYDLAKEQFQKLKYDTRLDPELREEVLHNLADLLYTLHRDDIREKYSEISDAYMEAMNYNLESPKVPAVLLKLGLINLKVGNVREAEAFFNILKDKYPDDDNVPLTYYYWGDYYYKNDQHQEAADQFQYVVQEYPDSKFVREASVGLAQSLYKLGYDKQAYQIIDYIEKRWPRYYVQFPPLLKLAGDVSYKLGNYDKARINYWTLYNIDPEGEDVDLVLARLGDIYNRNGKKQAAREVYEKAADRYPDKEGGLIAQMRLAEEGIYDEPSISEMFSVFDKPFTLRPAEVYSRIVTEHPDSPLAPLAQLKLAMWELFNKRYRETLAAVDHFVDTFPRSELAGQARDVALQAFEDQVKLYVEEENYQRIVDLWKDFPVLQAEEEGIPPSSRVALALSYWKTGNPDEALAMVDPFFQDQAMPQYSEMALQLALSILLENGAWDRVDDLVQRVELWELSDAMEVEFTYTRGLALENLNKPEEARPLWEELVQNPAITDLQKANAQYFLAIDDRRNEQFKEAYDHAQDSLSTFLALGGHENKVKDLLSLLMEVAETSGRILEALKWSEEYANLVDENSVEWPALQYRIAQLHKKAANIDQWRSILEKLSADDPGTLYGRMAARELKSFQLEQDADQYQAPQL